MPLNKQVKKVLVIGSGPIVIGQAAEFDYAGTQACRALKEEGLQVVLINSNPATIMTDKAMADSIYIEPLTLDVVKRVIELEKPDSLLSTLGGQTGLTLSMQLSKEGFLEKHGIQLLGAKPETIDKAEDRQLFKNAMEAIGQPCIPSKVVNDVPAALFFAEEIGYPVIVRPAFTLGGTGGGIAANPEELKEICENGLRLSPITQVLIERCVSGWKEIEFEVIRDSQNNVITVCSMENLDPVGVHTGDSIVVAPAVTLSDKEYQMLRTASLRIIQELGVEGGCNCQFALNPDNFEYAVIEVNPRVSRSSALASKATGYPIARVATKIAIGYTLTEILNAVTGKTYACFEPSLDYIVVKFPKWPFDKFVYGKRTLGTQMKATGEVMAIGACFEEALMKAVRSIELGIDTLTLPKLAELTDMQLEDLLGSCTDERLFAVYEALKRGMPVEEIFNITRIDHWFLNKLTSILKTEQQLRSSLLTAPVYLTAKKQGFLDSAIERISGQKVNGRQFASYKMVDTCAAEFSAETPYFYSSFEHENEAKLFLQEHSSDKKKVIVFGSGPIRIGQGIEFDYCSVHCVWALKKCGCEAVIANNNPETVSTDFDTADRLYFDPLTFEDVESLLETEKPWGVVVQFGGQTAIKLANKLAAKGVNILGTSADSIDLAEDRERFDELLERCRIPRPKGYTVYNVKDAVACADKLGYPVLLRPSYVLGGQNMIIACTDQDVVEYMGIIMQNGIENPVLIDKYMMGTEIEVDAVFDGENILIPGIMEHVERAGVHSGDSISVYPPQTLSQQTVDTIVEYTKILAKELKVLGLVNIQYVLFEGQVYVIEVNPRSSRTIPYISKVTGVPLVELATRVMLGEKLTDLGYGTGVTPWHGYVAVKVPVFSFQKLQDVDIHLGPEMKSTGEVLGIARTFQDALYKGLTAAGMVKAKTGGVLVSVRDQDKEEIIPLAKRYSDLGFTLYATWHTGEALNKAGVPALLISPNNELPTIYKLFQDGRVDYLISTSDKGRQPARRSVQMRRHAIERSIVCLTSLDTAGALVSTLERGAGIDDIPLVDMTKI